MDETSSGERNIDTRIMIVADGSTDDDVAAAVSPAITRLRASRPHGGLQTAISDLRALAWSTDTTLVGDAVDLRDARISAITTAGGFWVAAGAEQVFVSHGTQGHEFKFFGYELRTRPPRARLHLSAGGVDIVVTMTMMTTAE